MNVPAQLLALCICAFLISSNFVGGSHSMRDLARLNSKELRLLATSPDPSRNVNLKSAGSHLSKILIPRPPDTANNTFVRNYIVSTLRALDWNVEEDAFTDETPYGPKKFTNVIATKDPEAPMKLVLAAHFDSKFYPHYPDNQFVGATDSAAPCAILLDVAEALNPLLNNHKALLREEEDEHEDNPAAYTTLQLIFFDGEEAFKDWTHSDSIYGARHLAERWENEYVSPHPKFQNDRAPTVLSTIEHLVLLDLLGAENPKIRSYYMPTRWLFDALVSVESRLDKAGLSSVSGARSKKGSAVPTREKRNFFQPQGTPHFGWIEDDHTPFLQRGVSVLHVISNPFPRVWHTIKDDASALHLPTMIKWNIIFRVFTAEYLGLKPEVKPASNRKEDL